jgi:dipeptidyl aminopeptidase/acylaminoacyl peptidase
MLSSSPRGFALIRGFVMAFLALGTAGAFAQSRTAMQPTAGSVNLSNAMKTPGTSAQPAGAVESPDGKRSAWTSQDGRSVWSATRAGRTAEWSEPDRLFSIRGAVRNLVFSPDGKCIAFENPRSTNGTAPADKWSFIAVYDLAARRISYVDPGFDIDTDPAWSADGSQISFIRKVDGLADAHLIRPAPRRTPWSPPPPASSERFTVASVLSAPIVAAPVSAGDGRSIAYGARETTDRNIYFMRVGEPARRIVNFPGDDGQELSQVAVSQTGSAVAFVRGGAPNSQGDLPNPTALPDPPQQQVWIVGTKDDAPRFLGTGSAPRFTPGDRQVIWTSGEGVMGATLMWERGRLTGVGAPEQFFAGPLAALHFSPDGKRFAYQRAGGIEIYDLASKTAAAIPHANVNDRAPVWSPDGQRVAFLRQADARPGCGNYRYCGPEVSEQPWSIWQADISELKPGLVFQADTGAGSVYYPLDQGLTGDQIFWSENDRIAFVWERDGWRHLYSAPAGGGKATRLTPGDGEVETAALSVDRKQLIYATNIGDLGRRHLSAVAFDGTPARSITSGEASQWAPTPLAAGKLAFISAGWSQPPMVMIRDAAGTAKAAGLPRLPASFPAAQLVKPQLVEFPASDGQTAFGQLFVPAQTKGCAIIFSHGGIRRQMLPGFHYMDAYSHLYELNQYLAGRGCVVLSVEYRSSIMRGEAFRNAPGWGFAANSEMLDFVGAAKYLTSRKDVEAGRVGFYGLSWGGYMTSLALSQHSDIFKVGFDMAGVHNSSNSEGLKYSAMGNLDTWTSPVFLAQGDDDRNVSFTEGITLARALQLKRPDVELVQRVFPGETHDLYLTFEHLAGVYAEGGQFLLRHLGVQ